MEEKNTAFVLEACDTLFNTASQEQRPEYGTCALFRCSLLEPLNGGNPANPHRLSPETIRGLESHLIEVKRNRRRYERNIQSD